jgi:hypothetical protein
MKRRKFLKTAVVSGATTVGLGIYFPKPVSSFTLNRLLSENSADRIYRNFIASRIVEELGDSLPLDAPQIVIDAVLESQEELTSQSFSQQQTPYAQRRTRFGLLWGRQKKEDVGINAGFATIQIDDHRPTPIQFTGATTTGIDSSILSLGTDEKLTPLQLDDILIPTRIRTRDTVNWSESGFATYETREGDVIMTYTIKEPGKGGFGLVEFEITSSLGNYYVTTEVFFS